MSMPKSLLQHIFTHACNQGELAAIHEFIAPQDTPHAERKGESAGHINLTHLIATLRAAFPDLYCTIEDEISADDKVAAHWILRGTHNGLFLGNYPTGRAVVARGIIFARVDNGRIAEEWTLVDQMGILQQLGLIPTSI